MANHRFPLFLIVLTFLSASRADSIVRVGVILDMQTLIGKVSKTCISMAIEDFYSAHPNSTTRIRLSFRDAGGDPVGAASAALGFLKEEKVHAILGPQRSIQAKFVMELGTNAQVPVVVFSAKSPSLSSKYFVRAVMEDSSQARALAAIVETFKWREVVPIFEDSDYGNGMAPSLVEELQDKGVNVPYRCMIPFNATETMISSELRRLKLQRTRVFIVHASYELGSLIFQQAKKMDMMDKGYVWMTTYSLTMASKILGGDVQDSMEGVVGLRPYFQQTEKMVDFKQRWAKRFEVEHPGLALTEPIAFGLWAYDSAWALALAAKKLDPVNFTLIYSNGSGGDFGGLGQSPVGPALLESILNSNFEGLTGRFRLVDGQLNSSTSEIVNMVGGSLKSVGFWSNVTRHLSENPGLKPIVWPGGLQEWPKGWEWPLNGQRLQIGVPLKPGFEQFVNVTKNPLTGLYEFSGFCLEVFHKVISSLPYTVPYDFVAFDDGQGQNNGTYDDLVYQVYRQVYDGVVGDVTILANRSLYVDFSLPYTDSGVTMVVPVRSRQTKSWWVFIKPFSGGLWLATGGFIVLTGLVVWFLEYRDNDDIRKDSFADQAGTIFYFAFSTIVFAHRDKVVGNWSRFVVLIWVFVVLILTSSYTASLTSLLTAQQLQPAVSDLGDLIKRNEKVGYLNDSFMPQLLKQLRVDSRNIVPYNSPEEYAAALDKGTANGGAAAIVDEIPYLKVFLSKYCGKYTIVGPTYKTNGFGFAFPKGSPMASDVSRAVLEFTEGKDFVELENKLYDNQNCPTETLKMTSVSLQAINFYGLFLITGITSLGALLFFIIHFVYNNFADLESIMKSETSFYGKLVNLVRLYHGAEGGAPETPKAEEGKELVVLGSPRGDGSSIVAHELQSSLNVSIPPSEGEDFHDFLDTPPPEDNEAHVGEITDPQIPGQTSATKD